MEAGINEGIPWINLDLRGVWTEVVVRCCCEESAGLVDQLDQSECSAIRLVVSTAPLPATAIAQTSHRCMASSVISLLVTATRRLFAASNTLCSQSPVVRKGGRKGNSRYRTRKRARKRVPEVRRHLATQDPVVLNLSSVMRLFKPPTSAAATNARRSSLFCFTTIMKTIAL